MTGPATRDGEYQSHKRELLVQVIVLDSDRQGAVMRASCEPPAEEWLSLLGADPRPWLLLVEDPAARWVALTGLLDLPPHHPSVLEVHTAMLRDGTTRALVARLADWDVDLHLGGHDSPAFAPNLLYLLADRGLHAGDEPRVERLLDQMVEHQALSGGFMSYSTSRLSPEPVWGSLLCDTHAITEVLVRFGRAEDLRVRAALDRMRKDLVLTAQGRAWTCIPDPVTGFRGPGRKGDVCPQVTLEAVRTFGRLPPNRRPASTLDAARVLLAVWQIASQK